MRLSEEDLGVEIDLGCRTLDDRPDVGGKHRFVEAAVTNIGVGRRHGVPRVEARWPCPNSASRRPGLPELRQCRFESWKLRPDNLPDQLDIDVEVRMDDPVAQTGDLVPRDLAVPGLELAGKAPGRLADHLEAAHDGINRLVVLHEGSAVEAL